MRSLLLPLAAAALACQPAGSAIELPRANGDVCENLAYTFLLIAEERDGGATRAQQVRRLRESLNNPFARRPEKTLESLLFVVDAVYAAEHLSPEELEAEVLDRCTISNQGHAVIRRPEPAPVSAGRSF